MSRPEGGAFRLLKDESNKDGPRRTWAEGWGLWV